MLYNQIFTPTFCFCATLPQYSLYFPQGQFPCWSFTLKQTQQKDLEQLLHCICLQASLCSIMQLQWGQALYCGVIYSIFLFFLLLKSSNLQFISAFSIKVAKNVHSSLPQIFPPVHFPRQKKQKSPYLQWGQITRFVLRSPLQIVALHLGHCLANCLIQF